MLWPSYALLMIFRFRDELREGGNVEAALVETMTHAGRSVIVSGFDGRGRAALVGHPPRCPSYARWVSGGC